MEREGSCGAGKRLADLVLDVQASPADSERKQQVAGGGPAKVAPDALFGARLLLENLDRQGWQDDAEGCSVALIIGSSKTTLMSFDNGAGHRKPDAHSLALGRDECVEYAVATDDT